MFTFLRPASDDGVGVAFTDGTLDLGDLQGRMRRAEAFAAVTDALGVPLAVVRQVHGNRVVRLDDPGAPETEADALVTRRRGVALAVRAADCIPVVFADAGGVIGAAHAGRAGVRNGVLARTVDAMRALGADDVHAWIGPHVCGACYEVPAEMAGQFASETGVPPTTTDRGTPGIDLGAAARRQLDAAGVGYTSLEACTLHEPGLHSFRRDGAASGRLAGIVWLSPDD